jgi:hypothetical protein
MSTVERSHDGDRTTRARPTALPNGPTAEERRRSNHRADGRFAAKNDAAKNRSAKQMVSGRERSALAMEIQKSVGSAVPDTERSRLLGEVVRLYKHTLAELPAHGAIVFASAMAFARETVVASALFAAATEAGVTTDRGLQLLEVAQRAEKRAEQASVHAFAIATRMAAKPGKVVDMPWFENDRTENDRTEGAEVPK